MSGNSVGSWYANCSFPVRNGVFYVGGIAPSVTLSKSGATAYEVRDWWGNIVSTGSVGGTTCTPTPPTSGWAPGWYRIYFTGPSSDATNGNAYAATMFTVIRNDPRFPPFPASTAVVTYGGESADPIAKGIMGLGHSRHIINDYATPTVATGGDTLATCRAQLAQSKAYWSQPGSPYADTRPRPLWVATPGRCADSLQVPSADASQYLSFYVADPSIDGSKVFIEAATGSTSGTKVCVYYPDSSTLVETFDNLGSGSSASTVINISSSYVRAFIIGFLGSRAAAAALPPTAIGRTVWNGITSVIGALYPDIDRYEFSNEYGLSLEVVHEMRLFQAAVHAGNPNAKAIGPCPVDISNLSAWSTFLAAGGGNYCDEISFHDYNSMTMGHIAFGRATITAFQALLAKYGQAGKALWQTEAGGAFTGVYGVHHPRRARVKMLHTLLWEQYGIPRERNPMWYDMSHGFWPFPCWWQHGDSSLTADAALHRVLAEETWGMPFTAMLDLGMMGQRTALASLYGGSTGQVVVTCATSFMPGATITFTTDAAGLLTVVDAFGRTSSLTVSNGRVTVPLAEIPTYLRLPAGASVAAYQVNAWPPVSKSGAWRSSGLIASVTAASTQVGRAAAIDDATWTSYGSNQGAYFGLYSLPDSITFGWETATRVDRLLIWCGTAWQVNATLVDFDIQTSNDATTWVTQATVTKSAPSSFLFGTNSSNTWCTQETFWDEQWVFDVPLPSPVTAKYVRLYVRAASYGGEPTAAALAAGGQGDNPRIVLQEVAVLCDDNVKPQWVVT